MRVRALQGMNPVEIQRRTLEGLVRTAKSTRFGVDHRFSSIRTVSDFQAAVPLRVYEDLWREYFQNAYPILENLTWPGRIPYLALTSGTTQGATKYIPVSKAMLASNRKAAQTMVAFHMNARADSRLFHGRMFFLGGSSDLERPAPGVRQGDLSGIAAMELTDLLRPYVFPPLELALETDWDRKLDLLAERSLHEPITLVGGVPSWLLILFRRLCELSGKKTLVEVWPSLEVVVHGGVKFDPYRAVFAELLGDTKIRLQESYPCSEGFIAFGDPLSDRLRLMFDHGIFYEFVPVDELGSERPTRHWLGNVQLGVNYAIVVSTCAGMWSHIIGDTVRFESLTPPLISFTGRTKYTLSAFGEHLISEEVEAALSHASQVTEASIGEWHVGPIFQGSLGYHQYVIEFLRDPNDLATFRKTLDEDLSARNADYLAHRAEGVGLPLPGVIETRPGVFAEWMRSRGKLGGQNKVPRMDNSGVLTQGLVEFCREHDMISRALPEGPLLT